MLMAMLKINVRATEEQWARMDDAQLDAEGEKIEEAFDKLRAYAQQLLGDKYIVGFDG